MWLNAFWVIHERTLNEWLKYFVGVFWASSERTHQVFSKKYLQDILKSSFWVISEITLNSPPGQYLSKLIKRLSKNSQFTPQVNGGLPPVWGSAIETNNSCGTHAREGCYDSCCCVFVWWFANPHSLFPFSSLFPCPEHDIKLYQLCSMLHDYDRYVEWSLSQDTLV